MSYKSDVVFCVTEATNSANTCTFSLTVTEKFKIYFYFSHIAFRLGQNSKAVSITHSVPSR